MRGNQYVEKLSVVVGKMWHFEEDDDDDDEEEEHDLWPCFCQTASQLIPLKSLSISLELILRTVQTDDCARFRDLMYHTREKIEELELSMDWENLAADGPVYDYFLNNGLTPIIAEHPALEKISVPDLHMVAVQTLHRFVTALASIPNLKDVYLKGATHETKLSLNRQ